MKRVKLTESQIEMIQNELKPKSIKLTEAQFNRIFDTDESKASFKQAMDKYKPQSEEENEKTFKSFNESTGTLSLGAFVDKLKPAIKDLMKGDYSSTEALANELGITKDDVISEIISLGIAEFSKTDLDYLRFRRDELKSNIKTLYNHLIGRKDEACLSMGDDLELTEDEGGKLPITCEYMNGEIAILKDGDNFYQFHYGDMDANEVFHDYADPEIADTTIGDKGDSGEVFHSYEDVVVDEEVIEKFVMANFNQLSKGLGIEGDEDGKELVKIDPALASQILDTNASDAGELTKILSIMDETTTSASSGAFVAPMSIEENEVPKITMFSDEEGVECKTSKDLKEEEEVIDEGVKPKQPKPKTEKNPKLKTPKSKKDNQPKPKTEKNPELGTAKSKKDVQPKPKTEENPELNEDELEEATTTASSGSYVTPSMWAKSKADHIPSKKPLYQGGQIVESKESAKLFVDIKRAGFEPGVDYVMVNNNVWAKDIEIARAITDDLVDLYSVTIDDENINKDGNIPMFFGKPEGVQAELEFPLDESTEGGKFVKFDDCTKLNNNTEAQEGKCSQGAVDGVVKTFETLCKEVSEACGKPMDEVKSVLLKNKMYESTDSYDDYMWIQLGKGNREAEEIRHHLEDTLIDGDTFEYMRKEFGINDVDLNNIIDILGL